jgi:hypothetical protein
MIVYHVSTLDNSKYNLCMGKGVISREPRELDMLDAETSILADIKNPLHY